MSVRTCKAQCDTAPRCPLLVCYHKVYLQKKIGTNLNLYISSMLSYNDSGRKNINDESMKYIFESKRYQNKEIKIKNKAM